MQLEFCHIKVFKCLMTVFFKINNIDINQIKTVLQHVESKCFFFNYKFKVFCKKNRVDFLEIKTSFRKYIFSYNLHNHIQV